MIVPEVNSKLDNLDQSPRWRGHFDGLESNGKLHGWAFVAANPWSALELDLYIHGIHIATTIADRSRGDIDNALGLQRPAATGFEFDMKTFRPEGALELLRRHGRNIPDANLIKDLHICIAGTRYALPVGGANAEVTVGLASALDQLVRAATVQLRQEIASGIDASRLSSTDYEILLLASPLFSARWYAETYGEVEITGLDPVEHYLRLGAAIKRPPGPWFDTADYLEVTPEARSSELNPVVHYEVHGHDSWWPGQRKFRAGVSTIPKQSDYALLIHVYHLDTIPDLQRLVANFPEDADIFVSIPKDSPAHNAEAIAALFPRAKEIVSVPNRGQDVAAFLEIVRRLKGRGYRFFCKVHSKKGNKYPDTWRRVMFDALAATPERVAKLIALFRSEPRLLMAGPSQFWLKDPNFELGNATRLEEFMVRLEFGGGTVARDWGFFAGTCFWIDAELAGLVAEAVPADEFVESSVTRNGQTAHAVERLFSLVAAMAGGQFALTDACNWSAEPVLLDTPSQATLHMAANEDASRFLARHLRELTAPQTVEGTAAQLRVSDPSDIFGATDTALHGAIDVMINCWMGQQEPMHEGLAHLQNALSMNGLTSAFVVSGVPPAEVLQSLSCANVLLDRAMLFLPTTLPLDAPAPFCDPLPEDVAQTLLRAECLFMNADLPEGDDRAAALERINTVHAFWRKTLLRHKVKQFLIWGTTAPKSRLFIHLCRELGIEYQIIERGHFPGTLSIDPIGQFGTGARPRLVEHAGSNLGSSEADARFDAIRNWYETQQDNAGYAQFQKRDTRDLEAIHRARRYGRPVILVIGGNDQGAGVTSPGPDPLRVNWFGNSDNAFTIIRRLVSSKFPDALLVLRPHPSQAPQDGEFVLVARETALNDLIENSDICVTIGSTSRAICLLKEKPLLTLSLSELSGQNVGETIVDEAHFLAALRRHIWADFADPYPDGANRRFIVDLFDRHLVGIDRSVPTRHDITDLARLLTGRVQRMKTGFLQDYAGREAQISQAMFEDVRDRGRAIFQVDPRAFIGRERPPISVVLPIYGDYEGTRICFDQLVRHQSENNYRVIVVWDRGPDLRLRELCLEYAEKAGFTYLENRENVGFSGTVNSGILYAGRDDVILLNSDTVPCGDWALRLQDAAYAHPKIGSVVPFSNNATIYNLAFPGSTPLPKDKPVAWVEALDQRARKLAPRAVEMPVSHGYCTYVRRSVYDRLGLYSEVKFDKGHSEDNEFSLRVRMAGFFCVCPTNVVMGHAGSTSFGDDVEQWKVRGRGLLRDEFSHYFDEIRLFCNSVDPLAEYRKLILLEEPTA